MSKKILFSPIGNIDPISQKKNPDGSVLNYDGPMLHICRHYKPDIVYLYLSADMVSKEEQCKTSLEQLRKENGRDEEFEVHFLEMFGVTNPQKYDEIFKSFEEAINKMRKEKEQEIKAGAELMFNLSSGTPAMKSALHVIAATADYNVLPIQVDNPDFSNSNDRTVQVTVNNVNTRIKKEIIKEHIDKYNYSAAFDVAKKLHKGNSQAISKAACDFLELAVARVQLQTGKVLQKQGEVNKALKNLGKEEIKIISSRETDKDKLGVKVSEYALAMDIKRERKEYGDYVRVLSPLIANLFILIIEEHCEINIIENCCNLSENGSLKWDWKKMNNNETGKDILGILKRKDENPYVTSSDLLDIYKTLEKKDKTLFGNMDTIRNVEINVRNIAAHAIVAITKTKVETLCKDIKGITSIDGIQGCITDLLMGAGIIDAEKPEDYWQSYKKMNDKIKELL